MARTELPSDFLKNVQSIQDSFEILRKIKDGAEGEGDIKLSWRECQTLIWFIQMMKPRKTDG